MNRQLFIMAKAPQCGRVKTRLGQDIGMVNALWWYRHQLGSLIRRVGYDPRWKSVLAVSPDNTAADPKCWPSGLALWPQGDGNLGDRLERVFRISPGGPTLIIGTDVPDVAPRHIERAFRGWATTMPYSGRPLTAVSGQSDCADCRARRRDFSWVSAGQHRTRLRTPGMRS